jgi:hypothetical protein
MYACMCTYIYIYENIYFKSFLDVTFLPLVSYYYVFRIFIALRPGEILSTVLIFYHLFSDTYEFWSFPHGS